MTKHIVTLKDSNMFEQIAEGSLSIAGTLPSTHHEIESLSSYYIHTESAR